MVDLTLYAVATLASFAGAFALTPAFAKLARYLGLVVEPRADRWHREPTPLLGGAAMGLAVLAVLAATLPLSGTTATILAAAACALALGLLDDFRGIAPTTKLVGQVLIGALLVFGGVQVSFVPVAPVAFLLTVFWVVVVMNAVNLIDNMDGLAAGIAAIAGLALAYSAATATPAAALVALATAGAALGFLVHNFSPARIFMGDAGSQLLGVLLAASALLHTAASATNLGLALLAPLAALGLPLFDTTLVAVSRRLAGLPIIRGGRDHSSHRLAALGLTDRSAVLVLYAVAVLLAALGLVAETLASAIIPLVGLAAVCVLLFGVFLHEVDVYGRKEAVDTTGPRARIVRGFWLYGRFGAEVGFDAILLTIAYYSSYLIRFEGLSDSVWVGVFVQSVPLLVGAQLATLVILGVYRTLWRYITISDAAQIVRALLFGSAAAAMVIFLGFQLQNYSRAVFVLDAVLASALLVGSRSFLVWLRQSFASRPGDNARRVLIVGATDRGLSAMRLLTKSGDVAYRAVGFLDDDPGKRYRNVAGVPVVGTLDDIVSALVKYEVDLVVVAEQDHDTTVVRHACQSAGVELREFLVPV